MYLARKLESTTLLHEFGKGRREITFCMLAAPGSNSPDGSKECNFRNGV
jgi:hypothetical protein